MSGPQVGGLAARDPLLVLVRSRILLDLDPRRDELVDGRVDVGDLEVEHGELGGHVVRLVVDEDRGAAGDVELEAHPACRSPSRPGCRDRTTSAVARSSTENPLKPPVVVSMMPSFSVRSTRLCTLFTMAHGGDRVQRLSWDL